MPKKNEDMCAEHYSKAKNAISNIKKKIGRRRLTWNWAFHVLRLKRTNKDPKSLGWYRLHTYKWNDYFRN